MNYYAYNQVLMGCKMNSSKIFQLDMFLSEEQSEIDSLRERIDAVDTSTGKVRRSLFAKNGEMSKKMNDLEERMVILERYICRGVL